MLLQNGTVFIKIKIYLSIGIYKTLKKFLYWGLKRGIPFSGLRRVLRMQTKLLRHPSKGTIGFHSEQDKSAELLGYERSGFSWHSPVVLTGVFYWHDYCLLYLLL